MRKIKLDKANGSKMKLVYVEWEDAIASSAWYTMREMDEFAKEDNMTIKEIGWIYKDTPRYLVLVSRLTDEIVHGKEMVSYGHIQKIPKTWIRKRINLSKHIEKKR